MARVLNNLLTSFLLFLLTFCWVKYCLKSNGIAFWCALIVAVCFCYLFGQVQKEQTAKTSKTNKKKWQLQSLFLALQFGENNSEIFAKTLRFFGYVPQVLNYETLVATKQNKVLVALCYKQNCVTMEEYRNAVLLAKRNGCEQIFVFCKSTDSAVCAVAKTVFATTFVDLENTMDLMQQSGTLPPLAKTKTSNVGLVASIALNKKRFGWYFVGALFTAVSAVFSVFPLYNLLWATALFALAVYSLANKRYNTQKTHFQLP
ncbi:MAG: hypothetical protein IJF10_04690 [Clostridia bacterium]|nr:hypothetical protein [Clostridia bacterium]